MLTDEEIRATALEHIRSFGADLELSKPVPFSEPPGILFKAIRPYSQRSTNLVSPFFVLRESGQVVHISHGDVMPGIVTKLWGWAAMRADPELQRAIVDPDLSVPRHVEVWSQIVKECITAKTAKA